ncbi:MAG: hypothetical protein CMC96_14070 [Flavobacteriales bacterium]|nr:hypothetical protein [Flavobacteriales bacterium]|tara:strand:- start:12655 stop:13083 length:429 start_codon:yes stop_codon:yes gene_type:complete
MINQSENEIIWSNDFLKLHNIPNKSCGLFVATKEYIPIESFKNAFEKAAVFAKQNNWQNFIFDKRNLTVFHQPSMEWYYTTWKKELASSGLTRHFKILPKENWFKASVEAGKDEIKSKYPNFNFDAFEVKYVDNVDEALSQI